MTVDFFDSCDQIVERASELEQLVNRHLDHWPSSRMSHVAGQLVYIRSAIHAEVEKARTREAIKAANAADRAIRMEYTEHERAMAAGGKVKLPGDGYVIRTPAEFRVVVNTDPRPRTKEELDALMADQA